MPTDRNPRTSAVVRGFPRHWLQFGYSGSCTRVTLSRTHRGWSSSVPATSRRSQVSQGVDLFDLDVSATPCRLSGRRRTPPRPQTRLAPRAGWTSRQASRKESSVCFAQSTFAYERRGLSVSSLIRRAEADDEHRQESSAHLECGRGPSHLARRVSDIGTARFAATRTQCR